MVLSSPQKSDLALLRARETFYLIRTIDHGTELVHNISSWPKIYSAVSKMVQGYIFYLFVVDSSLQ